VIMSCLLLGVVLVLNYWTVMLIVRASEQLQEFDLGAILGRLPQPMGNRLQQVGNAIIIFSQFLVLLGYTVVIVDTVKQLSPAGSLLCCRPLVSALVAAVVLPLSLVPQRYLAFTSTLSILANAYLIGLLVYIAFAPEASSGASEGSAEGGDQLCIWGVSVGTVTMFSLLMYTIIIQMAIPPMYKELEKRTPELFGACLLVAFVCLFVIFAAVTICGYAAFGPGVRSSVLDSLPRDPRGALARVGMAVCILGCYPLNVKPMAAPFANLGTAASPPTASSSAEPLLGAAEPKDRTDRPAPSAPKAAWCDASAVASMIIVGGVSVASLWLHSLGPLNALNGAIQVFGYIGLIPGAIGLYLLPGIGRVQRVALMLLVVFALVTTILGFVYVDNHVAELAAACTMSLEL